MTNQQFRELLGKNLKFMRREKKLTQKKIAEFLNVTFQQIQKYEKGVSSLVGFKIKKYCDCLEVSFHDMCDPHYIERKQALKEVKELNNGNVKYKDFMNTYSDKING